MFEATHDVRRPLIAASVLCTALALSAQDPMRGQDPVRTQQDPAPMQATGQSKFASFEDVRGAKVHVRSAQAGATGIEPAPQDRNRTGDQEVGEVVDILIHANAPAAASTMRGRPADAGFGGERPGTGQPGQAGQTGQTGTPAPGYGVGPKAEVVLKLKDAQPQPGSERTVRVPLSAFEWEKDKKCLVFTRSRTELSAMPAHRDEAQSPAAMPGGMRTAGDRLMKASNLADARLESKDGEQFGKVERLVLDMGKGEAGFVLVSVGDDDDGYCAIPWRVLNEKDAHSKAGETKPSTAKPGDEKADRGKDGKSDHKSMTLVVGVPKDTLKNGPKVKDGELEKLESAKFRDDLDKAFKDAEGGAGRQQGR